MSKLSISTKDISFSAKPKSRSNGTADISLKTELSSNEIHLPDDQTRELALMILEHKFPKIAEQLVTGNDTINVELTLSPAVILELLQNSRDLNQALEKNSELEEKNSELEKSAKELERKLDEEKVNNPNYIPNEEDVFERDNRDGSSTYGELWSQLENDNSISNLARSWAFRGSYDLLETLQHLHRFKYPHQEDYQDIHEAGEGQNTRFSWEEKKRESKDTSKLRKILDGPIIRDSRESLSIEALVNLALNNQTSKRKVAEYCLICYQRGVQLQP